VPGVRVLTRLVNRWDSLWQIPPVGTWMLTRTPQNFTAMMRQRALNFTVKMQRRGLNFTVKMMTPQRECLKIPVKHKLEQQ
jgi:hypothetical protein